MPPRAQKRPKEELRIGMRVQLLTGKYVAKGKGAKVVATEGARQTKGLAFSYHRAA